VNLNYLLKILKIFPSLLFLNQKILFLLLIYIFFGCSSSKIYIPNSNSDIGSQSTIRVLLDYKSSEVTISVNDEILISDEKQLLAKIASGNKLKFSNDSRKLTLTIGDTDFTGNKFFISVSDEIEIIKIDGKKYRGKIIVSNTDSEIKVVNQLGLEEYVKGVMTKEMPVGKGIENYNALKCFSICIRTYAFNKIKESKDFFDIYSDTKDQVYGGVDGETEFTNSIVDETKGQLLIYENEPATIFYHSTCGGFTEDVKNVFSNNMVPYLNTVRDGDEPFCKISPRYEWTENYSESTFINRLYNAKLIESKEFNISDVIIKSRFSSGRVNELEISLMDFAKSEKIILLSGNQMRSIIKNADGKSILKSTLFDITMKDERIITISGKGNGHGVGLCQWGAIGQSIKGIDYRDILNHYFPGTKIKSIYD